MSLRVVTPLLLLSVASPAALAVTPFTVVAMPDPQNYTGTVENNDTYFKGQTNWIVANKTAKNIVFMMGLGDMQNPGNPYRASTTNWYEPDLSRPTNDPVDERYWSRADAAIDILDRGGVAYSLAPGNHDYLNANNTIEPIYWLKWFGPKRFANKPSFGGSSPEVPGATAGAMPQSYAGMNTYHFFQGGGRTYMNIVLEFAPDTNDLRWAQSIINQNPGIPTILTTHEIIDNANYQGGRQVIWDDLMRNNPQVIMAMCGHITGEHRITETNIAGQAVPIMLVDYQATEFTGYFKGGGYLRTMEFDPDKSQVRVKSYSPVIDNYLTDADSQFNLSIDINGRFGAVAGTPGRVTKRVAYRDGDYGYAGTDDTQVDATATTAAFGGQEFVWVDKNVSDNLPRHGLVRFTNLFGLQGIPAGAVIQSATLTLTTDTATNSQSGSGMSLYRMLKTWGDGSTWDSMGAGVAADGAEAILAANGTVTPLSLGGKVSFDVTESLYAWLSGAPNHGWALLPGGNDGWRFASSEAALLAMRPMLEVTFTAAGIAGDANADGVINADDFVLIDRGYARYLAGQIAASKALWRDGDFNADGVVNSQDYLLIDSSWAAANNALSPELLSARAAQFGDEYVAALVASVPEPAGLGLLGLGAFGLMGRRARRVAR